MKKVAFLVLVLLASLAAAAQGIAFETGSWSDVLAKAKETGKPVFVDVYTTWCGPCKMMSKDIFPREDVGTFYNTNFVCYKLDAEAGEGVTVAKQYKVRGYPTYLFVRSDGTVIYRFMGSTSAENFLRLTQTALDEFKDPKTLKDWDSEYATHQNDTAFLSAYIKKRNRQEIPAVDLLEAYIKLLPEADRSSKELVKLYLDQYDDLRIGTFAFDHLVANPSIFGGMYLTYFPSFLENIVRNSVRVAAKAKDLTQLDRAIEAGKQIAALGSNLSTDDIYLNYYKMSGDQVKFLHQVFMKCESQMSMTFTDSIQKNRQPIVANDLNENAWQVYLTISNKDTLQQALRWSKRAVELAPDSYSYLDTQACLLYKSGKHKQGIALEEKVLAMIPKSSADYEKYAVVLRRMKAGEKIWEK
jgi:thioredoxin-related protein